MPNPLNRSQSASCGRVRLIFCLLPVAFKTIWFNPKALNIVATNTEAVFVVVPSSDGTRTAAIQKEVAGAAATMTGKGTKVGTFLLSPDSKDYAGVVEQVGSPAVLAMVKGRGMAVVKDKEVTQEGLLKAYVGASRPSSGCCGSSSSGCK